MEDVTRDVSDIMHRKCGLRFEKSQLVEIETGVKPDEFVCYGCRTWWWEADGKVSIERLCLSPYVEKPFNSKVIKSFVPELRSRKWFLCFGIPMLYMCVMNIMNALRTGMGMYISYIHVWLCNSSTDTCCGLFFLSVAEFKQSKNSTENDPQSGHPKTSTTDEQANAIYCMVLDERHLTIQQMAKSIDISSGLGYTVLTEILGMRKLSARWIPKNDGVNAQAEKGWHFHDTSNSLPG